MTHQFEVGDMVAYRDANLNSYRGTVTAVIGTNMVAVDWSTARWWGSRDSVPTREWVPNLKLIATEQQP